jgi:hypothetical protein
MTPEEYAKQQAIYRQQQLPQTNRYNSLAQFGPKEFFSGLKEAVYDPIKRDFVNAYWLQRAARTRYPGADGVLNLTPYVGMGANLDDIQRSIRDEGTVEGSDLAGLALNAATTASYGKLLKNTPAFANMVKQQVVGATGGKRGNNIVPGMVMGASYPGVAYINHYIEAQQEANRKYGNKSLSNISRELQKGK